MCHSVCVCVSVSYCVTSYTQMVLNYDRQPQLAQSNRPYDQHILQQYKCSLTPQPQFKIEFSDMVIEMMHN
jgi:hypothetical protein